MNRLVLLSAAMLWATSASAQSACVQSPTGYYTCGGAVSASDNNSSLPTPGPNVVTVTGNNATIPVMPTPAANKCLFYDIDASATTTCVLANGTTVMHIPPLGSELPRIGISTQTGTPYALGATADEYVLCNATAQNNTITVPAAATAGAGRRYTIIKIDSTGHTCTVDANGSETINGALTQVISGQFTAMPIVTDGSNWFIY